VPSRLWFRLLLGTCLVLVVTLGAVVLLVNKALGASFQDYVEEQQSVRIQRAESILSRYYDRRREWAGVEASVQSVADLMGSRLVLADAQGRVIADSQGTLVGEPAREDWLGKRTSIRSQEFAVGTLYVSPMVGGPQPLDPRAQVFLGSLSSYLSWALLVGLLAAVALSVGLARWLASPMEALTRAVRGMEHGERGQHIDTSVGGEVGALAEAFNSLAQSLERVERLRQNMVTDIAHELRTPLSSIRGYLEAIQDGVVEPDEQTLATVHRELMQLTRLVDDLQELSLAEAHQLHLDREETDLRELVEWEVRAFLPQAAGQGVALVVEAAAGVPRLWVDAGRIRQVLANLIRNALAHTPSGGRIGVSVRAAGPSAQVAVADTGVGIDSAELEHIFERFYRVDKARARRAGGSGGTGLGLTIARELVRAHGGTLAAASSPGAGTTFTLSLPVAAPATAPLAEEPNVEAAAAIRPHPRLAPLALRGAVVGALFGALAGVLESLMATAQIRSPRGFLDLFGYAVLIDAAAFAIAGAVLATLAGVLAPLVGRSLRPTSVVVLGVPTGTLLVGVLVGYRWTQLFGRASALETPDVLYQVALIVVGTILAATVAGVAASSLAQHWPAGRAGWRRVPTFALVIIMAGASALVGRDQLANRLADTSGEAPAATRAAVPRSADSRPPAPETPLVAQVHPPELSEAARQQRRPNVLLVTVSGLRADHLGAYGYEKARTPALDALARQGSTFVHAMTPQPDRNAAHAAILTGTHPSTNGVRADLVDRLDAAAPTLAHSMAKRGYRTAAIYSWVSFEPGYSGLDRGFHDYLDLTINKPEYLGDNRAQVLAATYERLKAYLALPSAMGDAFSLQGGLAEAIDGRADVTTEAAIAWVEQHQDTPFFLWVHYVDPSAPFTPPAPFDEVEDTGCADACPDGGPGTVQAIHGGEQMSAAQINHLVALYDGEIAFTDQQIGRLMHRLDQLGLDDNTLVVVTSDFGQSFAEHGAWFAGSDLHNAETRIPLLVSMPARLPNRRVLGAPTSSVDIAPTILDTIGGGVPDRFEGRSLLPLILGQSSGDDRLAFSELGDRSEVSVSDPYWKLVWSDQAQVARLYFLGDDPNELNDRAASEPETTARLLESLREWRARHGG